MLFAMKYKHLFFDLDHTLWDFDRNSAECLEEIYHSVRLSETGISGPPAFIGTFLRINHALWDALDRGQIHHMYIRENRFRLVFEELGVICPDSHDQMGEMYLDMLPKKKHLLDGALEVLDYLRGEGYIMHIVTNGFDLIQAKKLASSGIAPYFQNVITFETANAKKPDPAIFNHAIALTGCNAAECIMIGDNWFADIQGATAVGLDTVFFNPDGKKFDGNATYEIRDLLSLKAIL